MTHSRVSLCGALVVLLAVAGCIPYTVGSTAQPVPEGETSQTMIVYAIPNGIETMRSDSSRSGLAWTGIDMEGRLGVSPRADVGVRIPSASGIVVNYKYRLGSDFAEHAPATAIMFGGGLVNLGNHAHFEFTFLASGRQKLFTPYGGARIGQVIPLSRDAEHDSPTAGGFLGLRIGKESLGVSAELGVFYDRSALELRSSSVIVVPAIVLHGSELINALMGGPRRR
jgi:hypothetical protein